MKPFPLIVLLLSLVSIRGADGPAQASDTGTPPIPPGITPPIPSPAGLQQPPSGAWLGCALGRPEASAIAQLPTLPPGTGLVVRSITPGSPAADAKIAPSDIICMFNDQILVNQGQLATLLNLRKPGDQVRLSILRAGRPLEVKLNLGTIPPGSDTGLFRQGLCSGDPPVIIDKTPGERVVSTTTSRGRIMMKREDEGYRVTIQDPGGAPVFEKLFANGDAKWEGVPDAWLRAVFVLRRSLDYSHENNLSPIRPPRPRVVVPQQPSVGPTPGTATTARF